MRALSQACSFCVLVDFVQMGAALFFLVCFSPQSLMSSLCVLFNACFSWILILPWAAKLSTCVRGTLSHSMEGCLITSTKKNEGCSFELKYVVALEIGLIRNFIKRVFDRLLCMRL